MASANCKVQCLKHAFPVKLRGGVAAVPPATTKVFPVRLKALRIRMSKYRRRERQVDDGMPQSNSGVILPASRGLRTIAASGAGVRFGYMNFKPVKADALGAISREALSLLPLAEARDPWTGFAGCGTGIVTSIPFEMTPLAAEVLA